MSVVYSGFDGSAPSDRHSLAARLDSRIAETDRALAGSYLALKREDNTRSGYLRDLRRFFAWRAEDGFDTVIDASEDDIVDYLNSLRGRGGPAKPATRARHLATLRGFYKHCRRKDAIQINPTDELAERVPDRSSTEGLDRAEARAMLEEARRAGPLALALVGLLMLMGLRVSEVCNAEIENISFHEERPELKVTGKGRRERVLPMPPPVEDAIRAATIRRASGPLLILENGAPLDRFEAWEIVTSLASSAGIAKSISPHSLRHTFATIALSDPDPSPLHYVQESMGHASPRTTLRYDRAAGARERFVGGAVTTKILAP